MEQGQEEGHQTDWLLCPEAQYSDQEDAKGGRRKSNAAYSCFPKILNISSPIYCTLTLISTYNYSFQIIINYNFTIHNKMTLRLLW